MSLALLPDPSRRLARRRRHAAARRAGATVLYWALLVAGAAGSAGLLLSQPADPAIHGGAVLLAPVGAWAAHRFAGLGAEVLAELRHAPLDALRAGAWALPLASAVVTLIVTVAVELIAVTAFSLAARLGALL